MPCKDQQLVLQGLPCRLKYENGYIKGTDICEEGILKVRVRFVNGECIIQLCRVVDNVDGPWQQAEFERGDARTERFIADMKRHEDEHQA